MSRGQQLIRSSASTLASQGASTIISIVFIAYFARVFSREQMAVYAIMSMLASWNELLGGLGMHTLIVRDAAQLRAQGDHAGVKRLISSVLTYRTGSLALASLLWLLAAPLITAHSFSDDSALGLVQFSALIAFFMSGRAQLSGVQVALERFGRRAVIQTGTVLLERLFCVIGYFSLGIYGFFGGYLAAILLGTAWTLWDIRHFLTWERLPFAEVFRASRGLWGIKFIRGALDHLDRPLILALMGAEYLAIYFVAKRLYDNLYAVVTAILVPIGVKYGEVKVEGRAILASFFRKTMIINAMIFVPVSAVLMVTAQPLILLYGGEKYADADTLLAAFGFTLIGVSFWSVLREASLRLLEPRHLAIQYASSVVVTLLAYLLLVPPLQLVGIPIAMGLGYFAGLSPPIVHLHRRWGLRLPLGTIGNICACGACILMLAGPLSGLFAGTVAQLSVALAFSGLVLLGWLLLAGSREIDALVTPLCLRIPGFRWLFSYRSGG